MDDALLLWGMLFGSLGLGYILYGKKQQLLVTMLCGLFLIIFPYFVANTLLMVLIGAVLLAIPWLLRH